MQSPLIISSLFILPILSIDVGIFKWFLIVFIIVGITNAVNLTDGLDGLVAGSSAVSFGAILIIALYKKAMDR